MNDSSLWDVVTESTLIIQLQKPSYPCVISGIHPLWFTWVIGVILPHGEAARLEVLTNQNQLTPTLMEDLLSFDNIDQLMCWMETMKTESRECYPIVTLLWHTPRKRRPTTLIGLLLRWVVAASRMMVCFRG
jgi:hypothetical protein